MSNVSFSCIVTYLQLFQRDLRESAAYMNKGSIIRFSSITDMDSIRSIRRGLSNISLSGRRTSTSRSRSPQPRRRSSAGGVTAAAIVVAVNDRFANAESFPVEDPPPIAQRNHWLNLGTFVNDSVSFGLPESTVRYYKRATPRIGTAVKRVSTLR